MTVDRKDFLSFIIKPSGEVVPAMPHEEEFSVQQIWDQVAGYPELICETCDGFLLFRDRDASTKGLPLNPLATSVYMKYTRRPCPSGFASQYRLSPRTPFQFELQGSPQGINSRIARTIALTSQ